MFFTPKLVSLMSIVSYTTAFPWSEPRDKHAKPPAFFLAGDSTTAVQATNGGGWGDGFLNTTLRKDVIGKNYGHNGATTVSFRAGGDWDMVLAAAKAAAAQKYEPYVTIQFGHNDQKPEKNISMAQLTANLIRFVDEVRATKATPILVTSLSRRRFSNSTGRVTENLADVTVAAKQAAQKSGAKMIDLNAESTKYLNAIGAEKSAAYNLTPMDFTHLNREGSIVFGNLVAMLLDEAVPEVRKFVKPIDKIAKAIESGQYYSPAL